MVLPALFTAFRSLIPAAGALRQTVDVVDDLGGAFQTVQAISNEFFQSVIGANIELQSLVRQSSIVIAAQTQFLDAAGREIEDFDAKLSLIGPRIKEIQKSIEIETRNIVGATDTQTNAILNQVIAQFSQLQGQTKEFADELSAMPKLVANLTSAFNTFQIPDFQIPQEIRSLLQGDLNNPDSQLAKQLQSTGLTKEAFQQAQAQGKLLDLLIEKTEAFAQANASGAKSITNSFSVIQDVTSQFARFIGEEPTIGLESGLAKIVEKISDPEIEEKLKVLAKNFGEPIGNAISRAFTKITEATTKLFEVLGDEEFQNAASNLGKLFGDMISLGADAAIVIGAAIARIVKILNDAFDRLEKFTDLLADQNFENLKALFGFEIKVDEPEIAEGAEAAVQAKLEDFTKQLDQKGFLRKTVDFLVELTPLVYIRDMNLDDIESSLNNQIDVLTSEADGFVSKIDFAVDVSAKLGQVDTDDIENFSLVGVGASIEDEIMRLEDSIDYSGVSAKAAAEIDKVLDSISGLGDFSQAQRDIITIINESAAGGEEALERFAEYNRGLNQRLETVKSKLNEIRQIGEETGFSEDLQDEYDRLLLVLDFYISKQGEIAIASNSGVQAQKKLVEELRSSQDGTDELAKSLEAAEQKLKEFEQAAVEAGTGTLIFPDAIDQGNAVLKTFENLNQALTQFANTAGDNAGKIAADFEMLLAAVQSAQDLGSVEIESLVEVLRAASVESTLNVEQRLQAQQALIKLLQTEANIKDQILGLEKTNIDLLEAQGKINSDESALLKNRIEIKQKQLQIDTKLAEINTLEAVRQAGLSEELNKKIELKKAEVEAAEGANKAAAEAQLKQLESVKLQGQSASLSQQQLETEIAALSAESQMLRFKQNELDLDVRLNALALEREQRNEGIRTKELEAQLALAKARADGELVETRALKRADAAIEKAREQLSITTAEISARRKSLEGFKENAEAQGIDPSISKAKEREIQSEINNLVQREIELQTELINKEFDKSQLTITQLNDRKQLVNDIAKEELDSANNVEESLRKVEQAILDAKAAQQELMASNLAVQQAQGGAQIMGIELRLSGIDRFNDLERRIDDLTPIDDLLPPQKELRAQLVRVRDEIKETNDISSGGLQEQLKLIDLKAKKEEELAITMFNLKMSELEVEREIAKVKIDAAQSALELEKSRLALTNNDLELERQITEQQVESGEISEEAGEARIGIINNALQANQNVEQSLDVQLGTLDAQRENVDQIYDNREEILRTERQSEQTQRNTATQTERQDRAIQSAEDGLRNMASSSGTVANNSSAAADNYQRLGESRSGGSFASGNIFGVDESEFFNAPELVNAKQAVDDLIQRSGASLASGRGPGFDKALAEIEAANDVVFRETEKAKIRYQKALSDARQKFNEELEREALGPEKKTFTQTAASKPNVVSSNSSNSSFSQAISQEDIINQQIEIFTAQLTSLLAMPLTDSIKSEIDRVTNILDSLLSLTNDTSDEQVSLLEAIEQGAFQNGGFQTASDSSIFLDPQTGELIVSGTRPDEDQLNSLIEIDPLVQIGENQLSVLQSINQQIGESSQSVPQTSSTIPDTSNVSNQTISLLERERLLNTLEIDGLADLSVPDILKNLGALTASQSKLLKTRELLELDGVSDQGRIASLGGNLDKRSADLLRLRENIESGLPEQAQLLAFERLGFNTRSEAEQTLNALPSLDEIEAQILEPISSLPSLEELKSQAVSLNRDILEKEDFSRDPSLVNPSIASDSRRLSISDSGETTMVNNITNNFYPDQAGSVNAQLRTAAL